MVERRQILLVVLAFVGGYIIVRCLCSSGAACSARAADARHPQSQYLAATEIEAETSKAHRVRIYDVARRVLFSRSAHCCCFVPIHDTCMVWCRSVTGAVRSSDWSGCVG